MADEQWRNYHEAGLYIIESLDLLSLSSSTSKCPQAGTTASEVSFD
jgi:hypothetical protein